VVRVTARHEVGQLGVVGGVVAGITPTSESVASEMAGATKVRTAPVRSAMSDVRRILRSEHTENGYVAVRYARLSSCATAAISLVSPAPGTHGNRSGSSA
jgi:hypothetical protein